MTTWVEMYHPALPGTPHIRSSSQAVAENAARGWLVVDGSTPAPVDIYLTPGVGDLRYAKTADVANPATTTGAALRAAFGLSVVATVTASATLAGGKFTPVDATAAARTMTLPTGAADGVTIGVEKVDASANAVSVTGNIRGVPATTVTLPWQHETLLLRADSAGSWWPVAGHKTKSTLDNAYTPLTSQVALADMWIYGNSYDMTPGAKCTSGRENVNSVKAMGALATATTYGISGFRAVEAAEGAVGGKNNASAILNPGARGIIWVDVNTNDMFNPTVDGGTTAGALSTGQQNVFRQSIRTLCVLASASARYEAPASGTNWTLSNSADFSGGSLLFTSTQGASVDTVVTVPASGVMYALVFISANNGDHQWKVGSTVIGTFLAADANAAYAQWTKTSAFATRTFAPTVVKLTGLTPGSATITTVKTDAGTGTVYCDAFLAPSATPPLILLEKAPLWNTAASAPQAAVTSANMPTVTANKAIVDGIIDTIVASGEFPTAVAFDAALVPTTDLGTDGLHPNDRGMRKRSAAAIRAANAAIAAAGGYLPGLDKTL